MKTPAISIVVCTHNPTETFERALAGMDSLQNRDEAEILVMENACDKASKENIHALLKDRPWIRRVEEPILGLSVARNRGIQEARAPVVGFIDDDAVISPQWAKVILDTFAHHPEVGAIGGKVLLEYLSPPPAFLTDLHRLYLSWFDCGPVEKVLSFPDCPRGSNMAFRKEALLAVDGFSPHLGKVGGSLACFEEIDLCERLIQTGWINLYQPDALVTHLIEPFRFQPDWYTQRAYEQGKSLRIFERLAGSRVPSMAHLRHLWNRGLLERVYARGYLAGCVVRLKTQ